MFKEKLGRNEVIDHEMTKGCKVVFALKSSVDSASVFKKKDTFMVKHELTVLNETSDSIYYWYKPDSIEKVIFVKLDTYSFDTVRVMFSKCKTRKPRPLAEIDLYGKGKLLFKTDKPFKEIDTSKIVLVKDSVRVNQKMDLKKLDIISFELFTDLKYGNNYTLIFEKGAIKDIYGKYSDSVGFIINTKEKEALSTLILEYKHYGNDQIVLEILKGKGEVFRKYVLNSDEEIKIADILPDKLEARIIIDEDKNGQWTTGILDKRQPEKVYYWPKAFELKENWELVETIDIKKLKN